MTSHEAVVERILRASKGAGREEIANIAYRMARSCLAHADAGIGGHTRWFEKPQDIQGYREDARHIASRVGRLDAVAKLPAGNPSRESAISASTACIELAAEIEGDSSRVQFLTAKVARSKGDVEEYAGRLELLVSGPLERHWFFVANESLQVAKLKLGQYQSAADVGQMILARGASLPAASFNLATAYAWLELKSEFKLAAERFRRDVAHVPDPAFWTLLLEDEASWLSERTGVSVEELLALVVRDGSSS